MNELQMIIEEFKRAEEACQELHNEAQTYGTRTWFAAKAQGYREVIRVLEDFLSKHSAFIVDVEKAAIAMAERIQRIRTDLDEERSN